MTYTNLTWSQCSYRLQDYEKALGNLKYPSVLDAAQSNVRTSVSSFGIPAGSVSLDQITQILSNQTAGGPHGLQLLEPLPIPPMPRFPNIPTTKPRDFEKRYIEQAKRLAYKTNERAAELSESFKFEEQRLTKIKQGCLAADLSAIQVLMTVSHHRHPIAAALLGDFFIEVEFDTRIALCTVNIPDFTQLKIVRGRSSSWSSKWLPASAVDRRRAVETVLHSLCIRAAFLAAKSDILEWFDTIAVNGFQRWRDPSTGAPRQGVIGSMQAPKSDLLQLQPEHIDAKACFRHLKGINTPSVDQISTVRPIFAINTEDGRVIENREIADNLDKEANLATMPWEDFEHLVRQLFEWEFGRNGVEVKVTRASRDRGVDAIMFDPDPLRGGKYVLQAKRYTRTVDVAAVRDLYGTVMNEGANRGILVTTSSYGPDAYDFVKDKPLSLVDGPNLVALLKRHGRAFRINLLEARNAEARDLLPN